MAEIVTQANPGFHNQQPDLSRGRVIDGGSWKRQRIVYLMPADKAMPTKAHISHMGLIFPPNQPVTRFPSDDLSPAPAMQPVGMIGYEVGEAYSKALDVILGHPELSTWEYLLTVEADNLPPPDGVLKLLTRLETHPELHAVSGLYWVKGEGGIPQIWGDVKDPILNFRPQPPRPGELVECCGIGMGFALYRMSMFRELAEKKLDKPWFRTQAGTKGSGTQDLYFWGVVRPLGYRCAVDCGVLVGHMDQATGFVW